jgi:hypothetical protein
LAQQVAADSEMEDEPAPPVAPGAPVQEYRSNKRKTVGERLCDDEVDWKRQFGDTTC